MLVLPIQEPSSFHESRVSICVDVPIENLNEDYMKKDAVVNYDGIFFVV